MESPKNHQSHTVPLRDTVARGVASSLGAKAFYLVSRFLLPPLILSHISLAEYGLWASCFILIGYLGMGGFGVSHVYVRHVAAYAAERDFDAINRLVSTGFLLLGALNLILFGALYLLLPSVMQFLDVAPDHQTIARTLILFTSGVFLLELSLGVFQSVLEGLQRVPTTNGIWTAGVAIETVLIVLLLQLDLGVYALLCAFIVRYLFTVGASAILCHRALPELRLRIRNFDRRMLRLFYGYGSIVQLSGFLAIALRSAEKVLAGTLIGVRATGLYELGEKLPMMAAWIPAGMGAAFLPAASHLSAERRDAEIRSLYLKGCRYMSLLTGLIIGFLFAFAQPIITLWLGPDPEFRTAAIILAVFALPYHLNVVTSPASIIFKGIGKPALELVYPLTQLALLVLTVSFGLLTLGRTIPMINVTVASSMVLSALLYMGFSNRRLGVAQGRFFAQVLFPGLAPYAIAILINVCLGPWFPAAGSHRPAAFTFLAVSGALYSILAPLFIYRVLCRRPEREFLRQQTSRTARSFLPGQPGEVPATSRASA